MSTQQKSQSAIVRTLERIGALGNKLPDPLTLFVIFAAGVILASVIFKGASAEVMQRTGEMQVKAVQSLLSTDGIKWMFENAVKNFIEFAPLGAVLTVMIGIGVAERTGFFAMGLWVLV